MENMNAFEITLAAMLVATWGAVTFIAVWLWARTRDLRTDHENSVMVLEATEKDIRRDIETDRTIYLARFARIDERIADVEPRRAPAEKKTDDDGQGPIRQFATASGFRNFIEGNNQ
jgi:hypothetical protein